MVIDLNLKGQPLHVKTDKAMKLVAKDFLYQLQTLDDRSCASTLHLYENAIINCANEYVPGITETLRMIAENFINIMSILWGAISLVFLGRFLGVFRRLYQNFNFMFWLFLLVLCILGTILLIAVFKISTNPYYLHRMLYVTLMNGDWNHLMCFLNFVAHEKPNARPILIIRELNSLEHNTLYQCFQAMERAKKGGILFPIILETADTLWFEVPAVKKLQISFEPYFVKEMTYDEGMDDLVDKMKIWSAEEYRLIYSKIGGHSGSYLKLWEYIKVFKYSLERALNEMEKKAASHLRACIIQAENHTAVMSLLKDLKYANFLYEEVEIDSAVTYLIECNVLFYDGVKVYPQNKLLMNAIIQLLSQEQNNS